LAGIEIEIDGAKSCLVLLELLAIDWSHRVQTPQIREFDPLQVDKIVASLPPLVDRLTHIWERPPWHFLAAPERPNIIVP
jgi:hypothetical protein